MEIISLLSSIYSHLGLPHKSINQHKNIILARVCHKHNIMQCSVADSLRDLIHGHDWA